MGNKIFRKMQENRKTSTEGANKIGWSQRFFIFAAVMFLLGWASTGIMSSAKDEINLGFLRDLRSQEFSQDDQEPSTSIVTSPTDASSPPEINTTGSLDLDSENLPTSQENSIGNIAPIPVDTPLSTDIQSQVDNPENWEDWYCANCVSVPVRVKLTHYWPPLGGDNCWTFYDDYCYSPTKSTIPWESVIEISAACPVPWLGSVVEIPDLNRRYLCLDTGDKVVCKDGTCVVDVLTDKIYPWDGLEFDAIVYYPRVWVEPAPTFTPTTMIDQ
jgi:hypothetical protein